MRFTFIHTRLNLPDHLKLITRVQAIRSQTLLSTNNHHILPPPQQPQQTSHLFYVFFFVPPTHQHLQEKNQRRYGLVSLFLTHDTRHFLRRKTCALAFLVGAVYLPIIFLRIPYRRRVGWRFLWLGRGWIYLAILRKGKWEGGRQEGGKPCSPVRSDDVVR